jgi:hypothetical protein
MTPYEEGFQLGAMMREQRENGDGSYDCRFDLAEASRAGVFAEFKRGLEDGLAGKEMVSG